MICQLCNKNEATIHLTEIVDSTKVEVHVCEPCAKEQHFSPTETGAIPDLMLDIDDQKKPHAETELTCEKCGWSIEDFKREGKFGCPHDYLVFADEVNPLLKRIHHATKHVGKNPNVNLSSQVELFEKMRQQLEQAIAGERYEEAAILRDKMRAI